MAANSNYNIIFAPPSTCDDLFLSQKPEKLLSSALNCRQDSSLI